MMNSKSPSIRALYNELFTIEHEPYDNRYPDSAEYWRVSLRGEIVFDGISNEQHAKLIRGSMAHGYEIALQSIREII